MTTDKWEYRLAQLSIHQDALFYVMWPEKPKGKPQEYPLNDLGAQGWELVSVQGSAGYFKRRVDPQEAGR